MRKCSDNCETSVHSARKCGTLEICSDLRCVFDPSGVEDSFLFSYRI